MGSHTRECPEGSSTAACMTTSKERQPAAPSTAAAARRGHARRPTAVAAVRVMPFFRNVRRLIIIDAPPTGCSPFRDYSDGRRMFGVTLRQVPRAASRRSAVGDVDDLLSAALGVAGDSFAALGAAASVLSHERAPTPISQPDRPFDGRWDVVRIAG